jgi:hypothetical protein
MVNYRKLISQNCNRCSVKKYIRFEHELLADIEMTKSKGESFSAWVKAACRAKIADKQLTPLTVQARIRDDWMPDHTIALIIQMSQTGLFNQQIAEALNQQGITSPKGKRWTRAAVSEVLNRIDAESESKIKESRQ